MVADIYPIQQKQFTLPDSNLAQ